MTGEGFMCHLLGQTCPNYSSNVAGVCFCQMMDLIFPMVAITVILCILLAVRIND